jgi:hypothetical protein
MNHDLTITITKAGLSSERLHDLLRADEVVVHWENGSSLRGIVSQVADGNLRLWARDGHTISLDDIDTIVVV